ncbi:MAG: hypothetical protein PWQ20_1377 [Thermotogaceae bacterium]|nr:hypothetical protein [Thermotogaceae bacterium]MDN5338307.1 hypothetical protein [Thermotogaceae bacterium]
MRAKREFILSLITVLFVFFTVSFGVNIGVNMGELSEGRAGIFLDVGKASIFGNPAGAVFIDKWYLGYGMAMDNSQELSITEHDVFIAQPLSNNFAGFMKLILRDEYGVLNEQQLDEKTIGFSYSVSSFIFGRTAVGVTLNLYRLNGLEGKLYAFDSDIGFLAPIFKDVYLSGTIKGLLGWASAQNPLLPTPITLGIGVVANSNEGSLYLGTRFGGNLGGMEDAYITFGGRIDKQPVDAGMYADIKYGFSGDAQTVYEFFKNLISDVYVGGKIGISIAGVSAGIFGKFGANQLQTEGIASALTARGGLYISVEW